MEDLTDEEKDEIYSAGESVAEVPMHAFLRHNGVDPNSDFAQDLRESMLLGYAVRSSRRPSCRTVR